MSRKSNSFRERSRKLASGSDFGGDLSPSQKGQLEALVSEFRLSIARGEIQLIDGKWYVTHSGLIRLAQRMRCSGIQTEPVTEFSKPESGRWVFRAIVFKTPRSKGFVGYGDADPSNVSSLVRGAEMRVAETRAVNRALRKAYGIGLCSVEELSTRPIKVTVTSTVGGGGRGNSGSNEPRLRDRLLLLIREHRLDGALVKRYAAGFCGTSLREATREQVQTFIDHLARRAADDREALIAEMNANAAKDDGNEVSSSNEKEAA